MNLFPHSSATIIKQNISQIQPRVVIESLFSRPRYCVVAGYPAIFMSAMTKETRGRNQRCSMYLSQSDKLKRHLKKLFPAYTVHRHLSTKNMPQIKNQSGHKKIPWNYQYFPYLMVIFAKRQSLQRAAFAGTCPKAEEIPGCSPFPSENGHPGPAWPGRRKYR